MTQTHRKRYSLKRALAALLALASMASLAACTAGNGGTTDTLGAPAADKKPGTVQTLTSVQKPETAAKPNLDDYLKDGELDFDAYDQAYEAWCTDREMRLNQDDGWNDGMDAFYLATAGEYLSGAGTENRVYSPLNVYLALAMLAECTGGESRQQILDLLGAQSIEGLRKKASALWESTYCDDGLTTSILASSLWLNQDVSFDQQTLDTLAQTYYASAFQGETGSDAMNDALHDWLNEQTGGLLKDAADGVNLRPETVIALAATLYFRASWSEKFYEGATADETFHAPSGDTVCSFLHSDDNGDYYWGDKFEATRLRFEDGGAMWLLLPREGYTADDLLMDAQTQQFLTSGGDWEQQSDVRLKLALPKFDVSADFDLIDGLRALGVEDVFDASVSDFAPLVGEKMQNLAVSEATHAARVKIDEEGCEASAFTVEMVAESAEMPQEEIIELTFDRPFLFVVTAENEQPLFMGVVNQPVE